MTQNMYDDDQFFAGYARLPRSVGGLDAAPEWPSLRGQLPVLRGCKVVDLGCGYGWFCRWAREQGAASVLGIDVSQKMLAKAKVDTADAAIAYRRADLETVELPRDAFDLVYSSLTVHYIESLKRLVSEVHASLVPGGSFVFSAEHPIYTAPHEPGWSEDATGGKSWPVDHYLEEGRRSTNWLANGVVKYHRTIGTYVNILLRLGFTLAHVEEWGPTDAQIAALPNLADERHRPTIMLMAARR
jgi:SAM-dependent methyltransferase